MKSLKNILVLAAAVLFLAACGKEGTGSGDATVGFEKSAYSFSENAGTVNIPLKFSGEPAKYPIVLNVSASVDGGASIGDVVRFVQQIGSLRYNGKGEISIEMEIIDNYAPNDDVTVTLEIVSADGAEITSGRTSVTILDNDESLLASLQGMWKFYSMRDGNDPVQFEVGIDLGETAADEEENTKLQRLRVLGFAGYHYTDGNEPFQWFLDIVTDEVSGKQTLRTVSGIPLVRDSGRTFDDSVQSGDVEMYRNCSIAMWSALADDPTSLETSFEISAVLSEDGRTITFDPDWTFLPCFYRGEEIYGPDWGEFFNCRMERMNN